MTKYAEAYICAQVCAMDDGALVVDRETVATGEDFFLAARSAGEARPGSVIAVWIVDNLVLDAWSGEAPLSKRMAVDWIETSLPFVMLIRAEWDEFFQLPRQTTDGLLSRLKGLDSAPGKDEGA